MSAAESSIAIYRSLVAVRQVMGYVKTKEHSLLFKGIIWAYFALQSNTQHS